MKTQSQIYTEEDYLLAHLTVLDGEWRYRNLILERAMWLVKKLIRECSVLMPELPQHRNVQLVGSKL